MKANQATKFIIYSYFISWFLWMTGYFITGDSIPMLFLILGTFGPAIAALIISKKEGNLSEFLESIRTFKSSSSSYLIALFIFPFVLFLLLVFLVFNADYRIDLTHFSIVNLMILFPINVILGGALGEEVGWRGYLLKKLLTKYSAFHASLIVGVIWSIWHLPLFLTKTYENPIIQYFFIVIIMSFLFTRISQIGSKSLWPVVILHASFNTSNLMIGILFPDTDGILETDWYYLLPILAAVTALVWNLPFSRSEKKS